jgi:2-dehydropantoate 2-reductase
MKILILGAGAVGLSIAARLSHNADVTAVTRSGYVRDIQEKGLKLTGTWENESVPFHCTDTIPPDQSYDLILITTKAYDTESICSQYADHIRSHTVLTFQNGVGNAETIARFTHKVISGVVYTGFVRISNSEIFINATSRSWKIGSYSNVDDAELSRISDLFQRSGIQVTRDNAILTHVWSKNLISASLNPLSALFEVPFGELAQPDIWSYIEGIAGEYYAIVHRQGPALLWPDEETFLNFLKTEDIPVMQKHISSMLQDIRKKKRTEIDFMNGAIVRAGLNLGIPTPVNNVITRMIRDKEVHFTEPEKIMEIMENSLKSNK